MKDQKYNSLEIQNKWDKKWQELELYSPDLDNAKNKFYSLYMFPYPSAEGLHVGHAFSGTGADVFSRFKRMQGFDVLHPMGFDAFGIHSENYALKINDHPKNLIERTTKRFREQFDSLGFSYDWSHSVNTSDPAYYRWTQWLFVTLFNAGLAEKKKAEVNWCPSCKTVLADEQVLSGKCERCNSEVEKKELEQWFFKITKYADRLLESLGNIDWTEKVKTAQRNWIGKSEGALIKFGEIEVFTTRPDTLYGVTFLAISPNHPWVTENLSEMAEGVKSYIEEARIKNTAEEALERPKTGIFSGIKISHPATKDEIPVYIADYVVMDYGTGAVMGVPAHDERDFEFAKKYELPIKEVIDAQGQIAKGESKCYTGQGKIINSSDWEGWDSEKDFHKVLSWLEREKIGKAETKYHLRDWLISRQRYWGAPIPMIYCSKCGWQAVPVEDLPVELPYIENFKPLGTGAAPLAQDENFVKAECPSCGNEARRETDVADTFLDSSWYFLRYPSADINDTPFDKNRTEKWLPVDVYIGGAEHSVLHLLYARFISYALHDLGYLGFEEPFVKFRAHGLLIKEGAKMSKSRGNVINPDDYIKKYGADTLRCYLMFLGPYEAGGDFRDSGIEGMNRFLKRVAKLVQDRNNHSVGASAKNLHNENLEKSMHKTVKAVTTDIENLRFNTALAKIMEFVNDLNRSKANIENEYLKKLILLLAPFAPYLAEELWKNIGEAKSVHAEAWPVYEEELTEETELTIAVQINGKLRETLFVSKYASENREEMEKLALDSSKVQTHLSGVTVKKVVFVPGRIINFVI